MVVTDEFAVKFRSVASADQVAALAKKTRSKVKWTVSGLSVLTVPKGSDALAIANLYQESGLVEFAHPNFLEEIVLHQTAFPIYPNDEFFGRQFYLYNTGQVIADGHTGTRGADIKAPEAWAVTKGNACITIAVLDNGVSANHPDLPNARQIRLNGSNFADGDPNDPSPRGTQAHGNECAGIIAATQGNGEGISGVAPNCKIMPIRIFNTNDSGIPAADLARAILFAKNNGADIISSSWGYGTTTNPNHIPAIVDAIGQSTATGRNGKGCIVAFSSGNDNVVAFPSSVTISGVLTVGASDRNDYKAVYSATSNPGSGDNQLIDIVAPSHRAYPNQIADETFEVWTMDTEDANGTGDNPWPSKPRGQTIPPQIGEQLPSAGTNFLSYTGRFGGTSAACPQVAGIAALMLSINPNLSQQQVFDIITGSADKVGGYSYSNGRSNELGFGRVNARNAVYRTPALITITGPDLVCSSASFEVNMANVNWTATPTSLFTVSSGSGRYFNTAMASGARGNGTITATTVDGCGRSVSKTVRVGPAEPKGYFYSANSSSQPLQTVQFIAAGQVNMYMSDPYTFTFSSSSSSVPVSSYSGSSTSFYLGANQGVTIYATSSQPECGLAGQYVFSTSRGYGYRFAPNPASSELIVTATDPASAEGEPAPADVPFDADLYDIHGKKMKTKHGDHGKVVLDVRDLPEGLYNLRAGHGKEAISEHVQISH